MADPNVYAPPRVVMTEVKDTVCQRDAKFVKVYAGSDLPARCIVCNAPAEQPIKKVTLYWHSPWLYLLVLLNIVFYALVAVFVRKKAVVSPGLCAVHAGLRKKRLFAVLGSSFLALVGGGAMLVAGAEGWAIGLFLVGLVLLIAAIPVGRKVYPKEVTKEYARVAGCKEPFLASLE